jgi:glycosyltransferase involved in cell wall biosynthesis
MGGAEAMLCKLVTRSAATPGYEHYVVSLSGKGAFGDDLSRSGVPLFCLNMKDKRPGLGKLAALYLILRRIRPHILQTWLYHADLMGLLIGRLLPEAPKVIWNIRCSDMALEHYAFTTRLVFRLLVLLSRFPYAVVANSIAGKDYHIRSGYRSDRWAAIPNGFDIERFKPDPHARANFRYSKCISETDSVIGMVARYDPMKGLPILIHAALKLFQTFPDVFLVLAGEGLDHQNDGLRKVIADKNLAKRVIPIGRRDDIQKIFPAFDISTLASIGEGFPNVLCESMACGVPCVSTDVGDASHIIADTGLVVPPGDADALARAWASMLSLPSERRRELGLRARKRIEDHYSLPTIVHKYEDFYMDCWNGTYLQ